MTLNLSRSFLIVTVRILFVAAWVALVTVLMAGRAQTNVHGASQTVAPSAEEIAPIDWSVYRQW